MDRPISFASLATRGLSVTERLLSDVLCLPFDAEPPLADSDRVAAEVRSFMDA
jgi:hypothetical protein